MLYVAETCWLHLEEELESEFADFYVFGFFF